MLLSEDILEKNYNFYNPKKYEYHLSIINDLKPSDNNYTLNYYWRVPKDFSYKQQISLKSAIVTQNLKKCKIKLWSNIDLKNNIYYSEIKDYVETEIFDFEHEIKKANLSLNINFKNDSNCYLESDLFRILCLSNYGGFYCDMDTILLKDLSILEKYEFTYHWGMTGFDGNAFWQNNAFLKINPNSEFSKAILNVLQTLPSLPQTTIYGKDLFNIVRNRFKKYHIFPCAWFGVEWATGEKFDPMKYCNNQKMYDNIAWHWHNRWDEQIQENSLFSLYAKNVEEKFKKI